MFSDINVQLMHGLKCMNRQWHICIAFYMQGTSRKMGRSAWLLSFTILGERVVDPIHWTTSNRAPWSSWL